MELQLPPGFRFRPTEEELIMHYLSPKIHHPNLSFEGLVVEADIYKFHPAELTVEYEGNGHSGTWYFFTQVNRRFKKGSVINRETPKGTWKASTSAIVRDNKGVKIGVIKKLVFWETKEDGKEDKKKTDWMLHEYRIEDSLDSCVVCKIYHKKKNELDANEGKIKGTQPLNQIPPILVSEPSSDVSPQSKSQTLDYNLTENQHAKQPEHESSNAAPYSEPFYKSYDQSESLIYLHQDSVSDIFSEIFPDSALNFHVPTRLSYMTEKVRSGSNYDNYLNSSNFDMGGLLNNNKSSNSQLNNMQKCCSTQKNGTISRPIGH